jgi:hypothetical protein
MTYRELARRARYSASALSTAASGQALPTLEVLLAYVAACGADKAAWQRRWEELAAAGCELVPEGDAQSGGGSSGDQLVQRAPVAVAAKAAAVAPPERGKRQRTLAQPVRFGLAPLILATAAIACYAILRAASPDTRIATQPPPTAPALHSPGPAIVLSPARPTAGDSAVRPPVTAPASRSPAPAALPSSSVPAALPSPAGPAGSTSAAQPAGSPAGQQPQVTGPRVRFDFEQPSQTWFVFWGKQLATGAITGTMAYRGTHSYLVSLTGSTATATAAIGVDEDNGKLAGLSPGSAVTVHLRSCCPGDTTVRFWAMTAASKVVWAPQDAGDVAPLSPPGADGWSTMTWTVPAVGHVHAIGVQFYSRTGADLAVAIDDVSW